MQSGWDPRLQSDLSQYLCVLVSGFIEQAIRDVYREYADGPDPRIASLVSSLLGQQIQSPKAENIIRLARRLDDAWGDELVEYLSEERKAAIDGVVDNRHKVAHGEYTGISIQTISQWYKLVKEVVAFVESQCNA